MMEQMTKSELRIGMHVKLRDGSECVISKPTFDNTFLIDVKDGTHEELFRYKEDMRSTTSRSLDIIEVKDMNGNMIFAEEAMTKAEAEEKFGIRIVD